MSYATVEARVKLLLEGLTGVFPKTRSVSRGDYRERDEGASTTAVWPPGAFVQDGVDQGGPGQSARVWRVVRDGRWVGGSGTGGEGVRDEGALRDAGVAWGGGGSNGAGIFVWCLYDESVKLIGVEAAGEELKEGRHAATLSVGRPGILHGMHTFVLQDDEGQTMPVHSISAGLDYPGVGPEHAYWKSNGRVTYPAVAHDSPLPALPVLSETAGPLPAFESAPAGSAAIGRAGPV